MKPIKRFIRRFVFAWYYAYDSDKWKSFAQNNNIKEEIR